MKRVLLATVFGLLITLALPAAARKWTSNDGQFSTEAELVEFADGKVALKKPSGETIEVPLERLSEADRRFVRSATAKKPAATPKTATPRATAAKKAAKPAAPKEDVVSYVKDIQPFLETYCKECHNPDKAKKGYDVTTYAALIRPGKKGALVVPGRPDASQLILTMQGKGELMPPRVEGHPTPEAKAKVAAWIAAGARDDSVAPAQQKPVGSKGKARR